MAIYTPHFLVQFGGTVGTADPEIWSCSFRMHCSDYTGFDEEAYMTGVLKDALAAWMGRAGSKIANNCSLDWLKFNFINAAGHYNDPGNTNEYIWPVPVVGGVTSNSAIYQACVVITLRSNEVSRGLASIGRFYSPCPVVSTSPSTGLFATADALAIATSAALLLNTVDITIGIDTFRPELFSGVDGSHHTVDWVTVDNRVDIQRRRANNLQPLQSAVEILW